MNQVRITVDPHILWFETCSCRPVCYFEKLFWDDITKFWDENLLFTFLTGKLRKNLFWTNKNFVYLLIYHNKYSSQSNVPKYRPNDMKRFFIIRDTALL